jgi:hypothetical protein
MSVHIEMSEEARRIARFTCADLTVRDCWAILKRAAWGTVLFSLISGAMWLVGTGIGALVSGNSIEAYWTALPFGVRALIVALAVILMPGLVADLLAWVAEVLAAIATWLERSPLRQRLLVALLAVALLTLVSVPYVGFPLLGAVFGAGVAYLEIKLAQEKVR